MRLLRATDRHWAPWRNGGGFTSEVAAGPEGAGIDAFGWRASIARIDADGPFSSFPTVDRTLLLLAGGPLYLTAPGWHAPLEPGAPPFAFDGIDTVHATIKAPATVLNLMTRRGAWRHRLTPLHPPARVTDSARLLLAADPGITANRTPLAPLDAVLLDAGDTVTLAGPAGARLWSIAIDETVVPPAGA